MFCMILLTMTMALHTIIGFTHKAANRRNLDTTRTKYKGEWVTPKVWIAPETRANFINQLSIIGFVVACIGFNAVFWAVALREYSKDQAEHLEQAN